MTLKTYFAPLLLVLVIAVAAQAQTNIFTYQGRLTDGVVAASGTYEMQFSLFDSLGGPTQIGSTITNSSVTVTNGVFTVNLDFSPATPFASGADRFLEIAVRKAADPPGFTALSPRQQIMSSPYSIRTLSAGAADSLSAACSGCVGITHGGTGATTASAARTNLGAAGFVNNLGAFAATTSAQLAGVIVDETGVGALVFGTSPTLTNLTTTGTLNAGGGINSNSLDRSTAGVLSIGSTNATGVTITPSLTVSGPLSSNGGVTIATFAALGTAIDVSDADIVNAVNVGDNTILGGIAAIDFSNFDVAGNGNVTVGGDLRLGQMAAEPAGSNGLMYYNTLLNKFRCFEGGVWKDCIGGSVAVSPGATQEQVIEKLQQQLRRQQADMDALKKLLCVQNPGAGVCKPEVRQ